MAVYTQLPEPTIATFLAQHYDVGTLVAAQGIAQGVENTNYCLTVRDGAGERRYILTLYEKRVNPADLPFFLGMMQHVAQHGVACPAPIARRDGALYGMVEGKQAALISFLHGQSRTAAEPLHVAGVGTLLGQLHRATVDFPGTRANDLSLRGWQRLYAGIAGRLDTIEPGFDALVAEELVFLKDRWPLLQALPQGVIHADLFPDNVFFIGDVVSGMIDFYFACRDAMAYDVAITFNAWCFEPDGRFNPQKSLALMMHYQAQRRFTEAEVAAFPVLLRGAALRFLLTRAHDWLHHPADALVTPHDPREYAAKLRFHQQTGAGSIDGLA